MMAGHSHFSNTKERKSKQDAKKSKKFNAIRKKISNCVNSSSLIKSATKLGFSKKKIEKILIEKRIESLPSEIFLLKFPLDLIILLSFKEEVDISFIFKHFNNLIILPREEIGKFFLKRFLIYNFSSDLDLVISKLIHWDIKFSFDENKNLIISNEKSLKSLQDFSSNGVFSYEIKSKYEPFYSFRVKDRRRKKNYEEAVNKLKDIFKDYPLINIYSNFR